MIFVGTNADLFEDYRYMGSEGNHDYLYGGGLYYQNGTNYNWYDPTTGLTGVQATPKWDDGQPMVTFEGQDLQYSVCCY